MWIRQIIAGLFGLSAGLTISTGVIALITSIGIVPRLAGKTHTGKHMKLYETCILLGATFGNLFTLTKIQFHIEGFLAILLLGIYGVLTGVFVGCLATSLAESLNATSVFARRAKLIRGFGIIIFTLALSKMLGSIIQFAQHWTNGG